MTKAQQIIRSLSGDLTDQEHYEGAALRGHGDFYKKPPLSTLKQIIKDFDDGSSVDRQLSDKSWISMWKRTAFGDSVICVASDSKDNDTLVICL